MEPEAWKSSQDISQYWCARMRINGCIQWVTNGCIFRVYVYIGVCMCTYICVLYVYVNMYTCKPTYMYVCVCVCMYVCVSVCMYMYTSVLCLCLWTYVRFMITTLEMKF